MCAPGPVVGLQPVVEALVPGLPSAPWGVVLFGSAARAEATETSDLDLLVVADDLPHRFIERIRLLRGLAPASLQGKIALIAKSQSEFEEGFPSYYPDLGLDGIVLYDRERYMEGKLERIRELIELAGLTRRRLDHGFAWRWREPPVGHWRIDWSGVHGQ